MKKQKHTRKDSDHAFIAGGSGGLGAAAARELAKQGVGAISFSYNSNKASAESLAMELKTLGVKKVFFSTLNPSDEADVKRFYEEAVKATHLEITMGVYAIGISPNKPFEKQRLETVGGGIDNKGWREVYEVNVFGCMVSMRALALRMRRSKIKGSMVFITSTNGINSHSHISAHYDTSKAAQSHLMRIMAERYAKNGIRINGVAPGWVNTDMNKSLPLSERRKEMRKIWSCRFAEPHEIAAFIAFVLGQGGSYTYGQDFMIDGGYR